MFYEATVTIVSFWISSKVFPKGFSGVFLKGIFWKLTEPILRDLIH